MTLPKKTLARRDFLRLGSQCVAASLLGAPLAACAQSREEGVYVGSQRVPVIDIHAHCAFEGVLDVIADTELSWNLSRIRLLGPERLEALASRRIDVQVLSINQYWWYETEDEALAADVVRYHDEQLSAWCKDNPGRFAALSSIALQFPELAARQLEYAVKELGLHGASVGGHVNGVVPTGEEFDPFWAKAEELGVPVFVHPDSAKNIAREGAFAGRGDLPNIIGNPLETTLFLTQMMFEGTLDRFPNLILVGAHGGGYLPSYLGRTEVACEYRGEAANCANQRQPSEYMRDQILVDSMIFSAEGLRHLVAEMGASQVVYGTDIPFRWPDTLDIILEADFLSDDEKIAIVGGNLKRILKL